MIYKKHLKIFFSFVAISLLLIFSIIYYKDPLQIFHKSFYGCENYFDKDMRIQAAGIINNSYFDSVILGTSMLKNTSSLEASQKIGGNFINLSILGSSFYERSILLDYILSKKDIKKIIYSLDDVGMIDFEMSKKDYPVERFNYLYDDNKINDFRAYFDQKYLPKIFNFPINKCISNYENLDMPLADFDSDGKFEKFYGGIENWIKYNSKRGHKKIIQRFNNDEIYRVLNKEYLQKYLLSYIEKNPKINFILIIPPYSTAQYAIYTQNQKSKFDVLNESIRFLISQSQNYQNLKIYGFGDMDFTDDLMNYKDFTHYHYAINSKILDFIKGEIGLLTPKNIDEYLKKVQKKAIEYDLKNLKQEIIRLIEDSKNLSK